LKVRKEIEKLKEELSVNLTGDKTINNSKVCAIITLVISSKQEETVSVVSTNTQAIYQRSGSGSRACENVWQDSTG